MQEKNISRLNLEQCQKCSLCNTVCPMMAVNPAYPGPKRSGPDGERYRLKDPVFYDEALKYCLNCKRCEVACPSDVKIADMISEARLSYGHMSRPLRDWTLANTDLVGSLASPLSGIVNPVLGSRPVKYLMDKVIGVDERRRFPSYSKQTFEKWFRSEALEKQVSYKKQVSFFHGCYINYNYPQLGKDLVSLMNACGYGVRLLEKEKCCGVALIANGLGKQAASQARTNMSSIRKALDGKSEAVLGASSTCMFTMRDEYPHVLGVGNDGVRDSLMLAVAFIARKVEEGSVKLAFRQDYHRKMAYHTACHMQKLGWSVYSIKLLRMIPGLELEVLDQECCGIAGTFAFKKENYDYSQAIGSKLFSSIAKSGAGEVVTECETCKWQIEMSAGVKVLNPVSVLVEALDMEKTKELNSNG